MSRPEYPRPVADVDLSLPRLHRARWTGVTALALVVCAAIAVFASIIITQQQRLQASCQFYRDLSVVPLPMSTTVSRLTVEFQIHAREAFDGEGCGTLPPPDHSLVHWAQHYRLSIPR